MTSSPQPLSPPAPPHSRLFASLRGYHPPTVWTWPLCLLPLFYLWFRLLDNLRLEWTSNPQYSYGLVVPLLALGLLLRCLFPAGQNSGIPTYAPAHRTSDAPARPTSDGPASRRSDGPARRSSERRRGPSRLQSAISNLQFAICNPVPSPQSPVLGPQSPVLGPQSPVLGPQSPVLGPRSLVLCLLVLAFLYLPTRLVEAATPEWRPIQWMLAIQAVGITLCFLSLLGDGRLARHLAVPVAFILVAVPWPTMFEAPLIQGLSRFNAATVVEVVGVLGVPAMAHGNLIEVGTGTVGINDACSGIRSFQSSLMVSIFFGEFFRLGLARRLLLVPIGFSLAMLFNLCRASLLTFLAATKGMAAISEYHDSAGLTILLACMASLWAIAALLSKKPAISNLQSSICNLQSPPSPVPGPRSQVPGPQSPVPAISNLQSSICNLQSPQSPVPGPRSSVPGPQSPVPEIINLQSSICNLQSQSQSPVLGPRSPVPSPWSLISAFLLTWFLSVEAGVFLWYHLREAHTAPSPQWTVVLPEANSTFQTLPISQDTRDLLRFDQGKQGRWKEPDGTEWQAFYFSWLPGRVSSYLAKRHTPDICLPAAGCTMREGATLMVLNVHGLELPVRHYVFDSRAGSMQVYQCHWQAGAPPGYYTQEESSRFNLIRGIWAGRGVHGQKVLEIIISGIPDADQAKQALVRQLNDLIKVEDVQAGSPNSNDPPGSHIGRAPAAQAPLAAHSKS